MNLEDLIELQEYRNDFEAAFRRLSTFDTPENVAECERAEAEWNRRLRLAGPQLLTFARRWLIHCESFKRK